MRLGFPKLNVRVQTHCMCSNHVSHCSPKELGSMWNDYKCETHAPAGPWAIQSFVSDLGVSRLLLASVILRQANLAACKKGKASEPSQFFTLPLGLNGQKRMKTGIKEHSAGSELVTGQKTVVMSTERREKGEAGSWGRTMHWPWCVGWRCLGPWRSDIWSGPPSSWALTTGDAR